MLLMEADRVKGRAGEPERDQGEAGAVFELGAVGEKPGGGAAERGARAGSLAGFPDQVGKRLAEAGTGEQEDDIRRESLSTMARAARGDPEWGGAVAEPTRSRSGLMAWRPSPCRLAVTFQKIGQREPSANAVFWVRRDSTHFQRVGKSGMTGRVRWGRKRPDTRGGCSDATPMSIVRKIREFTKLFYAPKHHFYC